MVGSHVAYVNGFQTSQPAVVFHLYARKIAQGIGNGMGGQPLELFSRQALGGYDSPERSGRYYYFLQLLQTIEPALRLERQSKAQHGYGR